MKWLAIRKLLNICLFFLKINEPSAALNDSSKLKLKNKKTFRYNKDPAFLTNYAHILNHSNNIYFHSDSVDQINENFVNSMNAALLQSGLKTECIINFNRNENDKPWFNKDCKLMENKLKKSFHLSRKSNFECICLGYLSLRRLQKNYPKFER